MNKKDIRPYNDKEQRHGHWEVYYTNGNLMYKTNFINGQPHGYWLEYWGDGSVWIKGNYVNGKRNGSWEYYDKYGKLYEQIFYT